LDELKKINELNKNNFQSIRSEQKSWLFQTHVADKEENLILRKESPTFICLM